MVLTSIPWDKGAGLNGETDHSLAERAAAGDRQAFARIVSIHQGRIARLAQRLLGWDPEVEDVVQDVFATAWQRRRQLREPDKLRSWLTAITVNAVRSRLRKVKLRRVLFMKMLREHHGERVEADNSGGDTEHEEVGRLVREAMSQLPQRDKEVLVLRYMEHMPVGAIAETLGLTVSAITGRLHRARLRLAEYLPRELQP